MNPDDRRLLLDWLAAEEGGARRLPDLLTELAERRKDLAPLARILALKETEDRARMAVLDRERWFRSFSWKMITALFMFGVLGMMFFILWGGDQAFLASIFFIAGGASFYLLVQAMASWRSRHDQKALTEIRERCRGELAALRKEIRK